VAPGGSTLTDLDVMMFVQLLLVAGNETTTNLIGNAVHALLDLGLDRLVGDRNAWINIPREVLVSGIHDFLPPDRVVLELLETVEADSEVMAAIEQAKLSPERKRDLGAGAH
jgi:c-di-GMP-related signal transduction protein